MVHWRLLILYLLSVEIIFIKVACCITLLPPDDYSAARIDLCILFVLSMVLRARSNSTDHII